jgi:hypothetical protein
MSYIHTVVNVYHHACKHISAAYRPSSTAVKLKAPMHAYLTRKDNYTFKQPCKFLRLNNYDFLDISIRQTVQFKALALTNAATVAMDMHRTN